MNKRRGFAVALALIGVVALVAAYEPSGSAVGLLRGEPFFDGRAANGWGRALRDPNPANQEKARQRLKEGGAAAVPVLAALVRGDKSGGWSATEERLVAAKLLRDLGPTAAPAVPTLMDVFPDGDAHLRAVAADALAAIGPEAAREAVPTLIAQVGRDDPLPAIKALARFGPVGKDAGPALLPLLKHPDTTTRWNAAKTLGKIRDATAVAPLIDLLKDTEAEVREHAAEALGDIGPPAAVAVEPLITVLRDENTKVRRDAVRSLGKIGPAAKGAIPAIRSATKDPEAIVRDAAEKALRELDAEPTK